MRLVFGSLLIFAGAASNVFAEASHYSDAVGAYNRGDYGTSIKLLNMAINSSESKNADAHYYLASAYLQLGNKVSAQREYQLSLKLAPRGQSAIFCKQALDHLAGTSPTNEAQLENAKAKILSKNADAKPQTYPVIKISGLPAVPAALKDDGPTLSEILLWRVDQQASYYLTAFNRKNQALAHLEDVQGTLKRVESLASSAVPNARGYGETDADTKKRVENGRAQLASVLAPYNEAVELAHKSVEQTNSIYETCLSAGRRMSGY